MRAVRFHDYGPPSALTLDELPDPTPGPGEVLIEVTAAGINFSDVQLRAGALRQWAPGLPLPFTPGHEVAGTVIATGPGADPALTGRRVIALSPAGGGYADLVTVPEAAVLPAPDLGEHEALAVLTQGTTAVGLLDKAAVSPGETVLVEAATGGVGSLLVQLAKHAGATVIAAVGDEKKAALARELGADHTVDLTSADGAGPVQVVFESVGGPLTRTALDLLEPTTGRMILYGNLSGLPHEIDPATIYQRALSVNAFATALLPPERLAPLRDRAFALAAEGVLRPRIGSVRPLTEAAAAHQAMEDRATTGKNILVP
ncbi:zinc-binding alcohol dehydrogenase family protein [Actinomadura viridis]|uniref:quinone oxidoreductase family protein n=1 Tax=Actinomadura viridis TaxID=58110 RepID=UPI0036865ABA